MASTIWQDIKYGARMLLKNPGVTIVVIIALALGIGANSAIFSVVNAVFLRPLPYEDSDRLVFLNEKSAVLDEMSISYPNFTDWRNQNQTFEKMGVYNRGSYNLTGAGEAERIVTGSNVSGSVFRSACECRCIGRVFNNEEDKPGGTPVAVLSYALWQRRFGGQASVLNQAITLNGKSYTIIGVMPETYAYPSRVEMWVPVGQLSDQPSWQSRGNHPGLYGVARLKPGVTFGQAEAEMDKLARTSKSSIRIQTHALASGFVRCWRSLLATFARALGDLWRGWFRVADRLRQHRKSFAGACDCSQERDGDSHRGGRRPLAHRAPVVD